MNDSIFSENSVHAIPVLSLLSMTGLYSIFSCKIASFSPFSGSVLRFCNAFPAKMILTVGTHYTVGLLCTRGTNAEFD